MKKEIAKELRENAAIVASKKDGKDIRNAITDSFVALATIIEEDEIPLKKIVSQFYYKGIWTGVVTIQVIIIIVLIVNR